MTYAEKLKSPHWQKKRLEILNRDNFTCQCCQSKDRTLHVHHRYYSKGRSPWEYPDDALVTLCATCHKYETERLEMVGRIISRHDNAAAIITSLALALDPEGEFPHASITKCLGGVDCALRLIRSARLAEDQFERAQSLVLAEKTLNEAFRAALFVIAEIEEVEE